jgi:uncharacterized membrane protein (DUF4010 family)
MAFGVIAACTVLFVRVGVVTLVLTPALARAVVGYLTLPFIVGAAALVWGVSRDRAPAAASDEPPRNPLQVWSAVQMAAMFQLVLIAVELVSRSWGSPGVIASGAVLGLTDIDALTISMARGAAEAIAVDVAARALAVGILANTALKLAIAIGLGTGGFRAVAGPALAAMAAAIAGTLFFRP